MKKQIFKYCWHKPKEGDLFINADDLRHAICNSDQFPVFPHWSPREQPTPEQKLVSETLDAVFEAIKATPKYKLQGNRLLIPEEDSP